MFTTTKTFLLNCQDPADCLPRRSYRLFLAREILREMLAEAEEKKPS